VLPSWDAVGQLLAGGTARTGIFLRCETSHGPMRVWSGVGQFEYGGDLVEADPTALWDGFGELRGLPQLQALINGLAQRADITLSGAWLSAETIALATWLAPTIRSAVFNVGLMILDDTFQPAWPMRWLWAGIADSLTVERNSDNGQAVRSLTLSVGTWSTGRRRPNNEQYTDQSIRAADPTDSFGMYFAQYNAGSTRNWPNNAPGS
jgi:hypothetical protein